MLAIYFEFHKNIMAITLPSLFFLNIKLEIKNQLKSQQCFENIEVNFIQI